MKNCPENKNAEQMGMILQEEELSKISGGLMRELNGNKYMVVSPCYPCQYPDHYKELPDDRSVKSDNWSARGIWFNLGNVNCCGRCNCFEFFPGTITGYCPYSKT